MIDIEIKSWACDCGYSQDFEPTQENLKRHFGGGEEGTCPSCALRGVSGASLVAATSETTKTRVRALSKEDVDTHAIKTAGISGVTPQVAASDSVVADVRENLGFK